MSGTIKTVKINGITYDASTGLPVKLSKPTTTKKTSSTKTTNTKKPTSRGKTIHRKPSRSTTLKRNLVRNKTSSKPTKTSKTNSTNKVKTTNIRSKINSKPLYRSTETITVTATRHPLVTHFPASRSYTLNIPKEKTSTDTPTKQDSNPIIDEFDDFLNSINEETTDAGSSTETNFEIPDSQLRKGPKIAITIVIIITIVSLISLLVLLNFHSIQMFIASARTDIPGQVPAYTATGFRLNDISVTSDLNIEISYQNNRNQNYTIIKNKATTPDADLQFYENQPTAIITKNGLSYVINYGQLDKAQVQKIADNL